MAAVVAHEQVGSLSTVKTPSVPTSCRTAFVQAVGQNVYMTLDGSTPSGTNGFVLRTTDPPLQLNLASKIKAAKFLEVSASAVVNLIYFGDNA